MSLASLPAGFGDLLHHYRMAVDTDALAPWQLLAIAATTLLAAVWMESRGYARRRTFVPGFRAGVLMGFAVSALSGSATVWLSFRSLRSGAIKCLGKHCHGTDFVDLLGRRHLSGESYVSMTFDPAGFWFSYMELSVFTVLALAFLFSSLRAAAHWKELD